LTVHRSATYFPMDTQPANRIWPPTQPRHYTTREKIPLSRQLLKMGTRWPETCWATYKEQLIRRNKYDTKWHLVGFLFHIKVKICLCETNIDRRPYSFFLTCIKLQVYVWVKPSSAETCICNEVFNKQMLSLMFMYLPLCVYTAMEWITPSCICFITQHNTDTSGGDSHTKY